jgi:hypothetical protein
MFIEFETIDGEKTNQVIDCVETPYQSPLPDCTHAAIAENPETGERFYAYVRLEELPAADEYEKEFVKVYLSHTGFTFTRMEIDKLVQKARKQNQGVVLLGESDNGRIWALVDLEVGVLFALVLFVHCKFSYSLQFVRVPAYWDSDATARPIQQPAFDFPIPGTLQKRVSLCCRFANSLQ